MAVLISSVAQRAPVLANRVLAITRRLFKWAIGQGLIEVNPCDKSSDRLVSRHENAF